MKRMSANIEAYLPDLQDGFKAHRGCRNATTITHALVERCVREGRRILAVFIDYADAFSSTSHVYLDEALGKAGVSAKLRRLIRVILRAAKCAVRMRAADGTAEISPHFDIGRGVLHGDIFSPACFIVGLQALFTECDVRTDGGFSANGAKVCASSNLRVPYQCYADDAALWTEVEFDRLVGHGGEVENEKREMLKQTLSAQNPDKSWIWPLRALKERAGGVKPVKDRRKRENWVECVVDLEMPRIYMAECEAGGECGDEWVLVDHVVNTSQSAVDAVRAAVQEATAKVTTLAQVSLERAGMIIKIPKTKAMLVGSMDTGCVREEDCVAHQAQCVTHVCENCQEGFPKHASLVHHQRN